MTQDEFRRIALSFPGAEERAHMGHPDFRVEGKIFATLAYPDESWGMVQLSPEHQRMFVQEHPNVFSPVPGGWGLKGSTRVRLANAGEDEVRDAMAASINKSKEKKRAPRSTRARS